MLPDMTLRFVLNKTCLKESGRHLTHTQQRYILQQNYTNLWHITVAMTVHESSQLHHTSIPAIIGGGLAEHDLRYFGKDLTHALAACIIMAASAGNMVTSLTCTGGTCSRTNQENREG